MDRPCFLQVASTVQNTCIPLSAEDGGLEELEESFESLATLVSNTKNTLNGYVLRKRLFRAFVYGELLWYNQVDERSKLQQVPRAAINDRRLDE